MPKHNQTSFKKGNKAGGGSRNQLRRDLTIGQQACKGAPWVIKAEDVAMFAAQKQPRGPVTPNPMQQTFDFQ